MPFSFENLTVYKKSLEWVKAAEELSEVCDHKLSPSFLNQLYRASLSIPLNIAEGFDGEPSATK